MSVPDPKLGRTHTSFYAQADPIGDGGANASATGKIALDTKGYPAPEKVLAMDPKIARTHTTFYSQFAQADPAGLGPVGGGGGNWKVTSGIKYDNGGYAAPEKVL